MRGELQAPLGDVGEVAEPAGVEHRAGQVGVGAGDEVGEGDQRQHRQRRGDHEQGGAPPPGGDRRGGDGAADRQDDRRADVGAEAPGGEDERAEQADGEEGRGGPALRQPRPEAGQRRAGPGDDEHAEQRLELVADPVEAHAEPGVGAEQRERGERRAGDHVDRVGERRRVPRRPPAPGSRRAGKRVSAASSGRAEHHQQLFGCPGSVRAPRPTSRSSGR